MITLTILTILSLGAIPLVKLSVKRQKEQRLRDALREMRVAIEEFHRDTIAGPCASNAPPTEGGGGRQQQLQGQGGVVADPRSKVMITDCTIFTVDNPDHYPPDLEALVNGVSIAPRGVSGNMGGVGLSGSNSNKTATTINEDAATKKKVYLRAIPVDPMTGQAEWEFRSSYDGKDADSWGGENVFDVRSKSDVTALNGEKYSDW